MILIVIDLLLTCYRPIFLVWYQSMDVLPYDLLWIGGLCKICIANFVRPLKGMNKMLPNHEWLWIVEAMEKGGNTKQTIWQITASISIRFAALLENLLATHVFCSSI